MPDLIDIIGHKFLICKQDVICKNKTFKKDSHVYPHISNDRVTGLYDIAKWNDNTPGIHSCPSAELAIDIDINNYSEYFDTNDNATMFYTHTVSAKNKLLKRSHDLNNAKDLILVAILIICVVTLILCNTISATGILLLLGTMLLLLITAGIVSLIRDNFSKKAINDMRNLKKNLMKHLFEH